MMNSSKFRIFGSVNWRDFEQKKLDKIQEDINNLSKDYVLNVDELMYIESLYSKYELEPIQFLCKNLHFDMPSRLAKKVLKPHTDQLIIKDIYVFNFKIPFTGSAEVLCVIPPTHFLINIDVIYVIDYDPIDPCIIREQHIEVLAEIPNPDKNEFEQAQKIILNAINLNVPDANNYILAFNPKIRRSIEAGFKKKKSEFIKENEFYRSIDLKVDEATASLFNANPIKKKFIPIPELIASPKEFFTSPQITQDIYEDVNKTILIFCKSIEKKPSVYKDQNEEALRFLILSVLESRYESTTATGETFNKCGKTDILLKYEDGSNLYVAECKIWKGEKAFLEAIDQLISYLTWRDSKTALIVFVRNVDFSSVLDKIEHAIQTHACFSRISKMEDDKTSISCIFNFPNDSKKQFQLEVMVFHFAKD